MSKLIAIIIIAIAAAVYAGMPTTTTPYCGKSIASTSLYGETATVCGVRSMDRVGRKNETIEMIVYGF